MSRLYFRTKQLVFPAGEQYAISTHESLIAFSNHEFYDNRMFTFPSANDRERHVIAVHVDGVY